MKIRKNQSTPQEMEVMVIYIALKILQLCPHVCNICAFGVGNLYIYIYELQYKTCSHTYYDSDSTITFLM